MNDNHILKETLYLAKNDPLQTVGRGFHNDLSNIIDQMYTDISSLTKAQQNYLFIQYRIILKGQLAVTENRIETETIDLGLITCDYKRGDDDLIRNRLIYEIKNVFSQGKDITLKHREIRSDIKEKVFDMYINSLADEILLEIKAGRKM